MHVLRVGDGLCGARSHIVLWMFTVIQCQEQLKKKKKAPVHRLRS